MSHGTPASLLIPTLNGGLQFQACLEGVLRQRVQPDEILVIDSGSNDGTPERAEKFGARVLRIPRSEFNHGATRDLGLSQLKTPLALLLVQDAEPLGEDWLEKMTAPFDDPRVAGVFGRQVPRDDLPPLLRQRLLDWGASHERPARQAIANWDIFLRLPSGEKNRRIVFDNVCSAVRMEVWRQHPFGRRSFGEDLDWAVRVLRAGHTLAYQPEARVLHSHNKGLWYEFKRVYLDHQNRRRLLGANVFPRLREVPHAAFNSWRAYSASLDARLSLEERLGASGWAATYFLSQNLAQWLGATLEKRVGAGPFARLDRWLARGV
jgi:rhamnosyltransferase